MILFGRATVNRRKRQQKGFHKNTNTALSKYSGNELQPLASPELTLTLKVNRELRRETCIGQHGTEKNTEGK